MLFGKIEVCFLRIGMRNQRTDDRISINKSVNEILWLKCVICISQLQYICKYAANIEILLESNHTSSPLNACCMIWSVDLKIRGVRLCPTCSATSATSWSSKLWSKGKGRLAMNLYHFFLKLAHTFSMLLTAQELTGVNSSYMPLCWASVRTSTDLWLGCLSSTRVILLAGNYASSTTSLMKLNTSSVLVESVTV